MSVRGSHLKEDTEHAYSDSDVGKRGAEDDGEVEVRGRRKIAIEFIENKSRRHITFSKRKAGIMKKAYELSTLTGTQVLLLVASETGHVYTFATPKLQPLITKQEGKDLIQSCLNAQETPDGQQAANRMSQAGFQEQALAYDGEEYDTASGVAAAAPVGSNSGGIFPNIPQLAQLAQYQQAAMAGALGALGGRPAGPYGGYGGAGSFQGAPQYMVYGGENGVGAHGGAKTDGGYEGGAPQEEGAEGDEE